jgi:hypothetical protein
MIEAIFRELANGLIAEPSHGLFRRGFRAMVDQEIETTDMNRLLFESFRSAHLHLKDAERQLDNSPKEWQHIEYARLAFVDAVHLDAWLPAVRAACYAGFCHRLRGEPQELDWYERSLSMILAIETRLEKKLTNNVLPMAGATAVFSSPLLDLQAVLATDRMQYVRKNLHAQMQIANEHKDAISTIVRITQRASRLKEIHEEGRLLRGF